MSGRGGFRRGGFGRLAAGFRRLGRVTRYTLVGLAALVVVVVGGSVLSTDGTDRVSLYDRAPVPAVPSRTAPIRDGALANGDYWVTSITAGADGFTLELAQAVFGQACLDEFGEAECTDDYAVVDGPARSVQASPATLGSITVAAENRQNYAVFPTELAALVQGGAPAGAAPDSYTYRPYPYLATVRDGVVVILHQIWVA